MTYLCSLSQDKRTAKSLGNNVFWHTYIHKLKSMKRFCIMHITLILVKALCSVLSATQQMKDKAEGRFPVVFIPTAAGGDSTLVTTLLWVSMILMQGCPHRSSPARPGLAFVWHKSCVSQVGASLGKLLWCEHRAALTSWQRKHRALLLVLC